MLHLRRSALRLLSSSSTSFASKSRTITSFSPAPLRNQKAVQSIQFQRRWATGEAEAKMDNEEVPISQIQATPEEEVENAIQSDNAAGTTEASAETTHAAEITEKEVVEEQPTAAQSMAETVSNAASSATAAIGAAVSSITGSEPESKPASPSFKEPKPTIYIGNLFFDVTENDLVKELSRFGKIIKCRLIRDSRGLSKGFGYVDFESTESATKAIETLNQQLFEGRRLAVQYALFESKNITGAGPRQGRQNTGPINPPSKTLFIGNMSFEMTDRDLNNLFRGINNVIDVRVAIDRRTGQPRGFAHADFIDVKSAMEAMKVLEQKETYGRKLRLDYSYGSSSAPRNQAARDMQGEKPSSSE